MCLFPSVIGLLPGIVPHVFIHPRKESGESIGDRGDGAMIHWDISPVKNTALINLYEHNLEYGLPPHPVLFSSVIR